MTKKTFKKLALVGFVYILLISSIYFGLMTDRSQIYQSQNNELYETFNKELVQLDLPQLTKKEWLQLTQETKKSSKLPPLTKDTVKDHIDFMLIKKLEAEKLDGYVPMSKGVPLGKSGVTIGVGFDIGQRSEQDLKSLGLPKSLVEKLKPYCGLTKWSAIDALRKTPLKITQEESNLISSLISVNKVRGIIKAVGEDTWNKLGKGLRTVLASVQFQYGDAKTKTPNFFKSVLSMDVNSVIKHLENFGDKYPTRRNLEANYLKAFTLSSAKKKETKEPLEG